MKKTNLALIMLSFLDTILIHEKSYPSHCTMALEIKNKKQQPATKSVLHNNYVACHVGINFHIIEDTWLIIR